MRRVLAGPRRVLGFAGRWTIPIIGGVTPVALIMVNIAVWINDHVQEIRVWVAVAAFLSGMMLNTWWCLKVYRAVRSRWPQWGIFDASHEELLLVLGMGAVTVVTFLLALGVYYGLSDTKHLPNAFTLWWGIVQILIPIVAKIYFDWDELRHRGAWTAPLPPPPAHPAPAEPAPATGRSGAAAADQPWSGGRGGYTPPGYLPPS